MSNITEEQVQQLIRDNSKLRDLNNQLRKEHDTVITTLMNKVNKIEIENKKLSNQINLFNNEIRRQSLKINQLVTTINKIVR